MLAHTVVAFGHVLIASAALDPRDDSGSCPGNCDANERPTNYRWIPITASTTITAATVIYVVDKAGSTRIVTSTNNIPASFTAPLANEAGTHAETVTIAIDKSKSTQIVLAYPTALDASPISYNWYGTLGTMDTSGKSVCSTAPSGGQVVLYSSHPPAPTLLTTSVVDSEDRNGYGYQLLDLACSQKPNSALNPSDAALTCAKSSACEISALPTALFLTQTSTSQVTTVHQGSPASTPQPVTPAETAQPTKKTTPITSSNVPTSLIPVLTTNSPSGAAPSIRASTALISSSTRAGVVPPSSLVLSATRSSGVQMFTSSIAEVHAPLLWLAGVGASFSLTLLGLVML